MRIPQVRLLKRLAEREGNSVEKTRSARVFSSGKYTVVHCLTALIHMAISHTEREIGVVISSFLKTPLRRERLE